MQSSFGVLVVYSGRVVLGDWMFSRPMLSDSTRGVLLSAVCRHLFSAGPARPGFAAGSQQTRHHLEIPPPHTGSRNGPRAKVKLAMMDPSVQQALPFSPESGDQFRINQRRVLYDLSLSSYHRGHRWPLYQYVQLARTVV